MGEVTYCLEKANGRSGPLKQEDVTELRDVFDEHGIGELLTAQENGGHWFAVMNWERGRFGRLRRLNSADGNLEPLFRVVSGLWNSFDFELSGRRRRPGSLRRSERREDWRLWGVLTFAGPPVLGVYRWEEADRMLLREPLRYDR